MVVVCGVVLCCVQVTKKIWAHVNEHKLKDPKDGRNIILDDKLKVYHTTTTTTTTTSPRQCVVW